MPENDFDYTVSFTIKDDTRVELAFTLKVEDMNDFCDNVFKPGIEDLLYAKLVEALAAKGLDVSDL